jgi:hypothetical protein
MAWLTKAENRVAISLWYNGGLGLGHRRLVVQMNPDGAGDRSTATVGQHENNLQNFRGGAGATCFFGFVCVCVFFLILKFWLYYMGASTFTAWN